MKIGLGTVFDLAPELGNTLVQSAPGQAFLLLFIAATHQLVNELISAHIHFSQRIEVVFHDFAVAANAGQTGLAAWVEIQSQPLFFRLLFYLFPMQADIESLQHVVITQAHRFDITVIQGAQWKCEPV